VISVLSMSLPSGNPSLWHLSLPSRRVVYYPADVLASDQRPEAKLSRANDAPRSWVHPAAALDEMHALR
jgi:hypothetical protein